MSSAPSSPLQLQDAGSKRAVGALVAIAALYLALVVPYLGRLGIGWDEQIDRMVARSYTQDPLVGSSLDPTQARLPMYLGAAVFAATGRSDVVVARALTAALGLATILVVFLHGWWLDGGRRHAVLGALLLATSPYFLAYSRSAFTESDMTAALLVTVALLLGGRAARADSGLGWSVATAVALGAAVASKFTAAVLIPAFVLDVALRPADGADRPVVGARARWFLAGLLVLTGVLAVGPWLAYGREGYAALSARLKAVHWMAVAAAVTGVVAWGLVRRRHRADRLAAILLLLGLTPMVAIALPPPHTTDPGLLARVVSRFSASQDQGLAYFAGNAGFYLSCLLLKSSPLVGALLCAALLAPFRHAAALRAARLPLLVFAFWFAAAVRIDYVQTFYLLPVLPAACALGASLLMASYERWRGLTLVTAAAAAAWLALDHLRSHPDYNLNGYQYAGIRTIAGRASIGYAGLATIPYDGVQQSFAWLRENCRPGQVVVAYIPYGILEPVLLEADPTPRCRIHDGTRLASPGALDAADYVISTFEVEVVAARGWDTPPLYFRSRGRHGYDPARLRQDFRRVFVLTRAFGIDVVSIWKRERPAASP